MKLIHIVLASTACAALLAGCGSYLPGYYDDLDYRTQTDLPTVNNLATMPAFYATNRQKASSGYSVARSDKLSYGVCEIHVPHVHNIGSDIISEQLSSVMHRPKAQPLLVNSTAELADASDSKKFFDRLNAEIKQAQRKDVLILVHGYNNSFEEPVLRAAELVHDLGEKMVPVAYCWTSPGTTEGYFEDENSIDIAARQLTLFLSQIIDNVPAQTRLHLVAHSMGSRVTSAALSRLKSQRDFTINPHPFTNLIFAAADIDAAELKARLSEDALRILAVRTTLYAGYNDRALELSERIHGRTYPRAGRAGKDILVAAGIDTVDVSLNDTSIVGHSYYGDNRAVVEDLFLLLVHDAPPQNRNLYHATKNGLTYWLIRP